MSAPALPPGFQPPAPPPPAPAAPTAVTAESLMPLAVGRCKYNGQPVETPEQQAWAVQVLSAKIPDLVQLQGFLSSTDSIELAEQVAQPPMAPASPTAPANPVSDSPADQVAQPPAAPASTGSPEAPEETSLPPEKLAAWDRISGQQCATVRGLKTRLTKTHGLDWAVYCERYGLDKDTGLPTSGVANEPPPPPGSHMPSRPAPASPGLPLQQGADGMQASLPPAPATMSAAAPEAPAQPPAAPEAPAQENAAASLPEVAYVGTMENCDYATPCMQVLPSLVVWGHGVPIAAEEVPEAYDWLKGAFVGIDGITENTVDYHIYQWFSEIMHKGQRYEMPVWAPKDRQQQAPMFQPASAPASAPAPAPAPEQSTPSDVITHMTDQMQQSLPVQHTMFGPLSGESTRKQLADTLGGAVSCVFLPLLDTATFDVGGRVDANQLAGQAEIMSLQQVTDPEDLKYRKDRKVAEQIFGQLLTQYPEVYVLMNGFSWVLPENLIPILLRRVCSGAIVKNGAVLELSL